MALRVERLPGNPIIRPHMDDRMGANINGPSLIRVPDWVERPLGRYYLYFADHIGQYIRLAFADALEGPWTMHAPGSLGLAESGFPTVASYPGRPQPAPGEAQVNDAHVASPDVHVLPERQEIRMYFHGLRTDGTQLTRVATSRDGIRFDAHPELLGLPYFRVFRHEDAFYALAMPGVLSRSEDGLTGFEAGPVLFEPDMRHSALWRRGDELRVFWTRVGDAPERILCSTISLRGDWRDWRESEAVEVLRPERDWEGAGEPVEPSFRGTIRHPVNQLRDPCVFEEYGAAWLLYAVAGEHGIALARLHEA